MPEAPPDSVTFSYGSDSMAVNTIMLYLTIVLFALAAIFGVIILKNWLTDGNTPRSVIYTHGALAAVALVLLLIHTLSTPGSTLWTSILLFVLAAIGGFYMFLRDLKGKFSPTWLAIVHALLAVGGFVFLLLIVI